MLPWALAKKKRKSIEILCKINREKHYHVIYCSQQLSAVSGAMNINIRSSVNFPNWKIRMCEIQLTFFIPNSYFIVVLRKLVIAVNSLKIHHANINVGKLFSQKVQQVSIPGQKGFQEGGLASLNAAWLWRKFMLLKHASEQVLAPQVCCEAFFSVSNHTGTSQSWRSRCFQICTLSIASLLWNGSSTEAEHFSTELAELSTRVSCRPVSFHLSFLPHILSLSEFTSFQISWVYDNI